MSGMMHVCVNIYCLHVWLHSLVKVTITPVSRFPSLSWCVHLRWKEFTTWSHKEHWRKILL